MHDTQATKNGEKKTNCSSYDGLSLGIQENDCEGRITYSNQAHHDILGYNLGELPGRNIWDTQPTAAAKQSLKAYFETLKVQQPPPFPFIQQIKEKTERSSSCRLTGATSAIRTAA